MALPQNSDLAASPPSVTVETFFESYSVETLDGYQDQPETASLLNQNRQLSAQLNSAVDEINNLRARLATAEQLNQTHLRQLEDERTTSNELRAAALAAAITIKDLCTQLDAAEARIASTPLHTFGPEPSPFGTPPPSTSGPTPASSPVYASLSPLSPPN